MRLPAAAFAVLLCATTASSLTSVDPAAAHDAALHNYESCTFDDGLQVATIDSLPSGVQQRTVDTKTGQKTIRMLAGRRILFAYGVGGDRFANVKPEVLPDDTWAIEKQSLLDEMDAMLSSDRSALPNTTLPPQTHGLEVHGFDRTELRGSTLGFYLLFDNARHIATSVYLLNQGPLMRRFQTIDQYRVLRSRFLNTYTGCIAQNQSLREPGAKDGP